MAYDMTESDKLYYNIQPKKTLPPKNNTYGPQTYQQFQQSGSQITPYNNTNVTGFNALGGAQKPVAPPPPPPSTTQQTTTTPTNTTGTTQTNPYNDLISQLTSYYKDASVNNTQKKVDEIEKQKAADLQALKDSIAARTTDINDQISTSREKFQPYRDQADVQRARNLQAVRELQASQGMYGGDNITAQADVNNSASQNISGIDQKEADYKQQLASQLAALKDASTQQQADVISKASQNKLATIDSEASRLANVNSNYLTQLSNALAIKQQQDDKNLQSQKDYEATKGMIYNPNTGQFEVDPNVAKAKTLSLIQGAKDDATRTGFYNPYAQYELTQDKISQINPYYNDLSAEIQRRQQTPDTSDDALIPYLQNAKFQKTMSLPENQRYQIGSDSGYLTQEGSKNYADIQQKQVQTAGYQLDNLIKNTELAYKAPQLQAQLQKDLEAIQKSQIENQYLPQEKMSEISQRISQAQAAIMNAQANVMDANTHATSAENSYNLGLAKLGQEKSQYSDKQTESTYNDLDKYIYQYYTSEGDKGRTVMTPQDKKDISAYLDYQATKGVDVKAIKSLKAKYGVD